MYINLNDPNPPAKFFFNEDDPSEGYLLIRALPAGEAARIRKLCSRRQPPEYRRGQRFDVPDKIDEDLMSQEIWDYTICGWGGILDENREEIPCTRDMKIRLIRESPEFMRFYARCIEQNDADAAVRHRDEAIKNSLSTSDD